MGRAEVGSAKYIANKIKAKGLQRLRWYCQVCEKQMRDENGFKCHTQSKAHLEKILKVGTTGNPSIEQYSKQFKDSFVYVLRTSHGEKPIGTNKYYNEFIQDRDHVHLNATRWKSLGAFVRAIEREGIIKVDGDAAGQTIAWIDSSVDAAHIRKNTANHRQRSLQDDRQEMLAEHLSRLQKAQTSGANPASSAASSVSNERGQDMKNQNEHENENKSGPGQGPRDQTKPIALSMSLKSKPKPGGSEPVKRQRIQLG